MKKKRNLYIIAFLCFITLVGVTIAYLGSTSVLENIFEAGTYKTVTHEEFTSPSNWLPGDTTPKTITTTNEGTIPVMVRVKFDEEWTSKNSDDLPLTYNDENVAIINFDNLNDWIYKDGYYYYLSELAPGESTSSLIKSVTFNPNVNSDVSCTTVDGTVTCESTGDGYDGATYKLKITTETVQSKDYESIWENVPMIYDYVGDNPCTFEGELVPGAEFVNGQYTYRFRQSYGGIADPHDGGFDIWNSLSDNGWGVKLTDWTSTDPVTTSLCSSINNKPIVSMERMFYNSQATSLDTSSFDTSNVTSMNDAFAFSKIEILNLSSFDTSKVTDMSGMFYGSQATTINVSSFDTSHVTNMQTMFGLVKVTSLDLSNFDTSSVTSMTGMFRGCKVSILNLSSFDTGNITDMNMMFYDSRVNILDLSSFDTSNVINMHAMFYHSQATSIDLSSFDTSNVTNMRAMFEGCTSLTTLDISSFDTSKVTNMSEMFNGCNLLGTIYVSNKWDVSAVVNSSAMFRDCTSLPGYDSTKVDVSMANTNGGYLTLKSV